MNSSKDQAKNIDDPSDQSNSCQIEKENGETTQVRNERLKIYLPQKNPLVHRKDLRKFASGDDIVHSSEQ
jgi:hypothetical protein